MDARGLMRIRGHGVTGPPLPSLRCRVFLSFAYVTSCTTISKMLYETSCSLFPQNSSDPLAVVSAAALLGSTSLEKLQ